MDQDGKTKVCKTCGIAKDISEFRIHNNECKKCMGKRCAQYQLKRRREDPDFKAKHKKYDPHHKVHDKVCKHLKRGNIVKGPCIVCGTTEKVQAHHEDYNKPFEIMWLCCKHHIQLHTHKAREMRIAKSIEGMLVCAN